MNFGDYLKMVLRNVWRSLATLDADYKMLVVVGTLGVLVLIVALAIIFPSFGLALLAVAVLAGILILRARGEHQRELKKQFYRTAIYAIRERGFDQFAFKELADQCALSRREAQAAAEEIYASYFRSAVKDAVITDQERQYLNQLSCALALGEPRRSNIERKLSADHYAKAFSDAISDGVLTIEETQLLEDMQRRLGMTDREAYFATAGDAVDFYRSMVRLITQNGRVTPADVQRLDHIKRAAGMPDDQSLQISGPESLELYRRTVSMICQDGVITPSERHELESIRDLLRLAPSMTAELDGQVNRVATLDGIRQGMLPLVRVRTLLQSGELCHWQGHSSYLHQARANAWWVDGHLYVTDRRLIFRADAQAHEIRPKRIIDLESYSDAIAIYTSTRRGTMTYRCNDAEMLGAIIEGVVKKANYMASASFSSAQGRHIPDTVKRQVWSRDGARCVRCRADDYLEFDHIIPHSKGGANSVNNIQLLCRRCNLAKSDRI